MERQRIGHVSLGGERHEMNNENTSVFRHLGAQALFDHLYIKVDENTAGYIWSDNKAYTSLSHAAEQAGAAMHVNLREVHPADRTAYETQALRDLQSTDGVPKGWD